MENAILFSTHTFQSFPMISRRIDSNIVYYLCFVPNIWDIVRLHLPKWEKPFGNVGFHSSIFWGMYLNFVTFSQLAFLLMF
jgi:hypothetical protein